MIGLGAQQTTYHLLWFHLVNVKHIRVTPADATHTDPHYQSILWTLEFKEYKTTLTKNIC